MASENHETVADVLAEFRREHIEIMDTRLYAPADYIADYINTLIDRISAAVQRERAAVQRERARDYDLIFRMMWFNAQEFREDWSFGAYAKTIRDCCTRIGIKYSPDGRSIAEAIDRMPMSKVIETEVCGE